jgi:hypothetical protein
MLFFLLAVGCASDEVSWAVHHASVLPSETALAGTQIWEFFTPDWASSGDADAFVCARGQIVTGTVTAALPGCDGCVASYELDVAELETDCASPLDADPYPGRSLGWYVSIDGVEMEPYGFAYDEALDWAGELGAPGWTSGQTYTLWPAYAWDLRE